MQLFSPIIVLFLFLTIQSGISQNTKSKAWSYPLIISDTVIDNYFGKNIPDPYRNLENVNDHVKTWINNQNQFYDSIICNISNRDSLSGEIQAMKNRQKTFTYSPRIVDDCVFYPYVPVKDSNTEILVYTDGINKQPQELFSTQSFNERDQCVYNFNYYEPSYDGNYIAFGISPNGNEDATIYIIDVKKKKLLGEKIEHCKAANISWAPSGIGFFYSKPKDMISEQDKQTPKEDRRVMFHQLYTDPRKDKEIFSRQLFKHFNIGKTEMPILSTFPGSSKVLVKTLATGSYKSVFYANLNDVLNKPSKEVSWKKICDRSEKTTSCVLVRNNFIAISFKDNPDGQLIKKSLPDTTINVLRNASDILIDNFILTKEYLYLSFIEKGLNKLSRMHLNNFTFENLALPFTGNLDFDAGSYYQHSKNVMFSMTSYDKPWQEFIISGKGKHTQNLNVYSKVQYTDTLLEIVVEENEVPSHDGAMVPLSIIYKKGIKLDGNNPTLLYAYGAYGTSLKPTFSRNRIAWFNHGGIYAVAHVRGGGEKGDNWYRGGLKSTKFNSWKDLITCAEYLINKKYTSSEHLAVSGASAAGITIGRAITDRPDLFKAAVIYAGDMNALRLETSTFNTSIAEFGSVKDSMEFEYLLNMDACHHIKDTVKYPSILFTGGLNDSRVPVWQPGKAVAKLQAIDNSENIILFRVEDKGHFDYPSDADVYSFLFWQLGHPDFKLKTNERMFKPQK